MVFIVMASCSAGPDGQGHTGGGRDEHGCIGSAGYIWCESKQRCIRPWLEDCKSLNPIQAKYNCDDLGDVKVEYRRSTAVLFTPDGEKFELERAVSASGARYAGEDAEIWDKAGSATLRIGSDEFSCIAKDN
jgi:membrane-bound inhibitor of C-type lysozyme